MTNNEAIEILKPLFEQCKGTDSCMGYIEHYFSKDEEKALDLAIAALEERPQGEWKYHKGDRLFLPYMECSNCKVQDLLGKLTKKEYREVNHFCFNCGAKMKGGKE